jgi:hypothetical protein
MVENTVADILMFQFTLKVSFSEFKFLRNTYKSLISNREIDAKSRTSWFNF